MKDAGGFTNRRPLCSDPDVYARFDADARKAVRTAMGGLQFDFTSLKNRKVMIKPNAGRFVGPRLGINTSPEAVAGVLDFFLEHGVVNLCVAESPILGVRALDALEKCGISAVARERGVPLVDLDAEKPVTVNIPNARAVSSLKVCRKVLETDFIVSVAVMKMHMHTQVSLGLKNMKGCLFLREKVRLHQLPPIPDLKPPAKPLDLAIADMAKILMPDLCVIDGSIGLEGLGPSAGNPRPLGAAVASFNTLGADFTAARLMGLDPAEIHHLQLARGALASLKDSPWASPENYRVYPEDLARNAQTFERPPEKLSFRFDNVRVEDVESCSACLSTVMMFLKRYEQDLADYYTPEEPLRLALGKGIGPQKEGTILVGNCAGCQAKGCVFIRGCPPVASDILKAVQEQKKNT